MIADDRFTPADQDAHLTSPVDSGGQPGRLHLLRDTPDGSTEMRRTEVGPQGWHDQGADVPEATIAGGH